MKTAQIPHPVVKFVGIVLLSLGLKSLAAVALAKAFGARTGRKS